jgi:soluble lytic murein transglycosylase
MRLSPFVRPIILSLALFAGAQPLPLSAGTLVAVAEPQSVIPRMRPGPKAPRTALQPTAGFAAAAALLKDEAWAAAYDKARSLTDPVERRAIQWAAIVFGQGAIAPETVRAFRADAPSFVQAAVFDARLEQALIRRKAQDADVIAELGGRMPRTLNGQLTLARAYVSTGDRTRAAAIISKVWVSTTLSAENEHDILAEFGGLLERKTHWARAVLLMTNDRAQAVERIMDLLSPAQQSLARARNAVSRNDGNAKALLDAVDPSLQHHPVYLLSRAERARQFALWDDALSFLNAVTGTPVDAEEYWAERQRLIRALLEAGDMRRAYAAAAGYVDGPDGRVVEARFTAGRIALVGLKAPATALPQFTAMARLATLPDSITQAQYWLGRTRAALGDKAGAQAAYEVAARYGTLYYGQLSREALGRPPVELRAMPAWRADEAAFNATERVRAVRLLAEAGLPDRAEPLLRSFATHYKDGAWLLLAARLAQEIGAHHLAITIADTAERRGSPLDLYNFPKDGLPGTATAAVDRAAVYAVARQESHFKVDAVSSSGALGLMQLMPATARETAKKIGLSYSADKLTSDGAYNALLGSTYLGAQLQRFDGSLVLAAAAYNAGAGTVTKWIGLYGDPRAQGIDVVNWIERIPVAETRQYVRRVVGNYLVYRARFGGSPMRVEDVLKSIGTRS